MQTPNNHQRGRYLHSLAAKLGMTEENYRDALAGYGVKSSKDLTDAQAAEFARKMKEALDRIEAHRAKQNGDTSAVDVIDQIEKQQIAEAEKPQVQYATKQMVKRLMFHAIPVAIHYCQDLGAYRTESGGIIQGEELRKWLKLRWSGIRTRPDDPFVGQEAPFPKNIMGNLYAHYINRKANDFLISAGHKRYSLDKDKLYYDTLPQSQVDYLIQRFREIHDKIDKRDAEMPECLVNP